MTLTDAIKYGGETQKRAKQLCEFHNFDPISIGCDILKSCGYEVKRLSSGEVLGVLNKNGKVLYLPDIVDPNS